ncbi:hypothetical protein AB0D49_25775 [Streptomyces sp. NPDC048290]|uniref:hypothetical protein n=1 Tax=Streptomyces sp. NPDC048290 TaxID=3155811 RepID=UPI00342F07CB
MAVRHINRTLLIAGAVLLSAAVPTGAQAVPEQAAAPVRTCAESQWTYPNPAFEIRTELCLSEQLGRLTPILVTECKYHDDWGNWPRAECDAKDLKWRLTAPDKTTKYSGSMEDKRAYFFDSVSSTDVPCSTGTWKFEMSSTHVAGNDSPNRTADTSQTKEISVARCS